MKDFIEILIIVYLISCIPIAPTALYLGVMRADCLDPVKRIEYVYPFHIIGCWLGEPAKKEEQK